MNPEQLDEIKKLAEAATLGEWPEDEHWGGEDGFCAQGPYHGCPHGGHRNARDVDACNEVISAAAVADRAFLKKMAESALPLVKALEEAWKERDEARAEVERLRGLLNPKPKPDLAATLMRLMREDQRKEIYSRAWQEAILEGNTREKAHRIAADAVEAALKEEG